MSSEKKVTSRGQPKIEFFTKYTVIYKVVQYMKRYNYTPHKAWMN